MIIHGSRSETENKISLNVLKINNVLIAVENVCIRRN